MHNLLALIDKFRDGSLTPQELTSLEEILRASPEARALFVEQCLLETQLYSAMALPGFSDSTRCEPDAGGVLEPAASIALPLMTAATLPSRRPGRRSWVPLYFGLAASLLLGAFLWWQPWHKGALPKSTTPVAVGKIMDAIGEVQVVDDKGQAESAFSGREILFGQKIQTKGEDSGISLTLPDATQVQLGPDSAVLFPHPSKKEGIQVWLESGAIQVNAGKQPQDQPLIFATAHAQAVVLGAKFRLYHEENASRVELEEGQVRLIRTRDGKQVEVPQGSVAVATAHGEPEEMGPLPLSRAEARLRSDLPRAGHKIAFTPNGKTLAGGRIDHLKTWSVPGGKLLETLAEHKDSRYGLVYSQKADTLFSLSDGKKLSAWDTKTGRLRSWPLLPREGSRDGAISGDGRWLAIGQVERKMFLWSLEKGEPQKRLELTPPDNPTRVALSHELPSGFPRLAYGQWVGKVEVLDLNDKGSTVVRQLKLSRAPMALAISQDGLCLATYSLPDGLQVWQLPAGAKHDLWTSQATRIECLRFSPDGKHLAAGMTDGTVRVWSTVDGQCLLVLDAGSRVVRDVAFSPDSALLATAGDNGLVRIWECAFLPIKGK